MQQPGRTRVTIAVDRPIAVENAQVGLLGGVEFAHRHLRVGDAIQRVGGIRVIFAEQLEAHFPGPPEVVPCLFVLVADREHGAEVEGGQGLAFAARVDRPMHGQRTLVVGLAGGEVALGIGDVAEVVERAGALRARSRREQLEGLPGQFARFRVATGGAQQVAEPDAELGALDRRRGRVVLGLRQGAAQ